jgi:hypothetical protein
MTLIDDVVCAVDGFHRLERRQRESTLVGKVRRGRAGRGSARTAATVSELISLLRNKLDMSSALVVPEQDQAIMTAIHAFNALTHLGNGSTDVITPLVVS